MGSAAGDGGDHEEAGARALLALLQRVQSEALRLLGPHDFDPKLYVDLPLAPGADLAAVEAALASVNTREEFEAYVARYFAAAGSDLLAADPPDFDADPRGFLPGVVSGEARAWALEVHALWRDLARRVAPAVVARPDGHTLLPLPGRVVVPGSRFREVYYWDSYWVVRYRTPYRRYTCCFFLASPRPRSAGPSSMGGFHYWSLASSFLVTIVAKR
jgi:alpha,alpha-trehalase